MPLLRALMSLFRRRRKRDKGGNDDGRRSGAEDEGTAALSARVGAEPGPSREPKPEPVVPFPDAAALGPGRPAARSLPSRDVKGGRRGEVDSSARDGHDATEGGSCARAQAAVASRIIDRMGQSLASSSPPSGGPNAFVPPSSRRDDNADVDAVAAPPSSVAPPPPPSSQRRQQQPWWWRGRDSSADLGASIGQTYRYLAEERPEMLEEDAVRRAIELSLLDCALVLRRPGGGGGHASRKEGGDDGRDKGRDEWRRDDLSPNEVLRVPLGATLEEIRSAYRRRARETHPDKGGAPGEFEAVARAYRSLLKGDGRTGAGSAQSNDSRRFGAEDSWIGGKQPVLSIKGTAHWDRELREHRNLVRELFQAHGADVGAVSNRQSEALKRLGLRPTEAGSLGRNERDEVIRNSCFYISLAASYLSGIGALASEFFASGGMRNGSRSRSRSDGRLEGAVGGRSVGGGGDDRDGDDGDEDDPLKHADDALVRETALQLKRIIEAAVVSAHPEWAARGLVGEEVQAFSDFLVYTLDSPTLVSEWAVVVFDAESGFVDVFKGKDYPDEDSSASDWARVNTLTVRYEPGHYQPMLPVAQALEGTTEGSGSRPALGKIIETLNETGVIYVITDGKA